jgi:alpha-D-ribose 1-methylphosphonate 5-triphosphate diphosphatase
MSATVFRNAKVVLPDEVIEGSVRIEDGVITAVDAGVSRVGEDLDGDYLVPGLVELHTDQLESHYRPRLGVYWNPLAALQAHDLQIAGSGITTVFDAVRIGSDPETPGGMAQHVQAMVDAISTGMADGRLKAEHLIHLRCELPTPDVVDDFERFVRLPLVKLASVMDHTPGQRQYQTIEKYIHYYKERMRFTDTEMEAFIARRRADQEQFAAHSRREILKRGKAAGIAFASHDDATEAQVHEAVSDGISIAEFPTTMDAAEASHAAGLAVMMGAPNIVRGGSHSGNIAATDLAHEGCLDVISSDYVPGALLLAAFMLPELAEGITLPDAIRMVTSRPAKAANLDDRGEIAPGKRGDVVRVRRHGDMPVVKGVWRQGQRVA